MQNLVLYFGDSDRNIACDFADQLPEAVVIRASNVTENLLDSARNKYQIGGEKSPRGVVLIAGKDQFDTMGKPILKNGHAKEA